MSCLRTGTTGKFRANYSFAEQISILKGTIVRNKKYIVERLYTLGSMDATEREWCINNIKDEQNTELDQMRIEDGLYEQLSFTSIPLTYDPPIYAGDLE